MKTNKMSAIILLSLLFIVPLTLHAQVYVDSTGALGVGKKPQKNTYFTIGDNTNGLSAAEAGIGVFLHGYKTNQNSTSSTNKRYYGIYSCVSLGDATNSIGLYGRVSGCLSKYAYGVIGCGARDKNGAGIYGMVSGYGNTYGENIDGSYAGYFAGPTYVKGTLTATEIITPSDITLKENIISIEDEEDNSGSTLDNVMNMNVIKYTYKPESFPIEQEEDELEDEESMLLGSKVQVKNRIFEMSQQKHYGLSAQEIREIYPDVVRESQNGTLGVNYLELVPILIRSIQELKKELDELKGNSDKPMMARTLKIKGDETAINSDATIIPTEATLAQNTPNPFTERTTIRFTLPENAKNAFIYIFDMSGRMQKQIPVDSSMENIVIEGHELPAGMYIYSLVIGGKEIKTRRMILTK